MPRKIKDLIRELEKAGFINRGGKGSHRNFTHTDCLRPVTLCGNLGEDVKPYQEKAVKEALKEVKQ